MRKIKRIVSAILSAALLASIVTAAPFVVSAAGSESDTMSTVGDTAQDVTEAPAEAGEPSAMRTDGTPKKGNPESVSADGNDIISRAEWLHNLALAFNMTVEEDNYPDNYFADIDASDSCYYDIMLATEFGVIDIPAGGEVRPNDPVTRDFAASTLNFCLGFQAEENTEYSFSDAAVVTHPEDAQIALDRGWFAPINGAYSENTEVTFAQAEAMLADAADVMKESAVDENYNSTYQFADGVKVVEKGTVCRRDGSTITIESSPVVIAEGDTFAVFLSDVPETFTAQSVSTGGNNTVVTVADSEQSGVVSADAQGSEAVFEDYFEPAEGVELTYEYEEDAVSSSKAGDAVGASGKKNIKAVNAKWGPIKVKLDNLRVEYIVSTLKRHYMTELSGIAYVTLTASMSEVSGMLGGAQANIDLLSYNVPGVGKASISLNASIESSIAFDYRIEFSTGFEYTKSGGFRRVSYFSKKAFSITLDCQLDVGIYAGINVNILKAIKGSVWARAGFRANLTKKIFPDGSKPRECQSFKSYIYADMGYSAGISAFGFSKSASEVYTVYDENNSPVRLYYHYEDGQPVNSCSRGLGRYTTPYSSRYGYCTYGGARSKGSNAAGEPFTIFEYSFVNDNNIKITKYYGNVSALAIPSTLDGYTVTEIGVYAFAKNTLLKSVSVPDTVTRIDSNAFSGCTNLAAVKLSKSLTVLEGEAFANTAIESIEIPKSLDKAGPAYINISGTYDGIKYVVLAGPFCLCNRLKTVTFEEGTTQIAENLFAGCIGLEEITIPDTVTVIESNAFTDCRKLKKVNFGSGLTEIGGSAFANCTQLTDIDIPDTVTRINSNAFSGCTNLAAVKLSKSLTVLEGEAFANTAIESIEIPKSLDKAGPAYINISGTYDGIKYVVLAGPFCLCNRLKTVTFEEGTTQIAENLFAGCIGLEEITIPDTVTVIESNAFTDCRKLKKVNFGSGLTEIGGGAFASCTQLTNIDIPDTVTAMGDYVFKGCESLISAKLPDTRKNINNATFQNCSSLQRVKFTDSVTAIREFAFANCSSLTEVPVSANLSIIERYAFYNCDALTDITIPSTVKTMGNNAFRDCEVLKNVRISDYSVTVIPDDAFADNPSLQSIVLPKGLQKISSAAFNNCTSLTEVFIPESVTSIADNAFSYPAKMTVYGRRGSYAEEYCQQKGIRFVDNCVLVEGIILEESVCDDEDCIVMETGEMKELAFEIFPEDANEVIYLKSDNNCVSISGMHITSLKAGDAAITAYTDGGTDYTFTIHNRSVTGITLPTLPEQLTVTLGSELDTTGLAVQVNYNDSTNKLTQDYTISGFDQNTAGVQKLTVSYTALSGSVYSATFNVEVVDPRGRQTGIEITKLPDRTTYIKREKLDTTGMIVSAVYDNGNTEVITDYKASGYNALKLGKQTITVTAGEFSATFEVEVVTEPDYSKGDINADGKIDITDATFIQKAIAELVELTDAQKKAADTNADGKVDITDATMIQKFIAELVDRLG